MAVSDYSGLAFELILQPSLLSEKLFSKYKNEDKRIKSDPEIFGVLQEFLQQLLCIPNLSNKIEPGFLSENTQRKRSFIQLMALQIHAFFQWDLDLIQKHLPLNLQSQLLEILLWTCRRSHSVFTEEKDKISVGEPLVLTKLEKCSAFAIQLYMRWVLRTFMTLNDPSPSGNKAQLYGTNFSFSGNTLSQETVMQLNSMRFTAVETLQKFIPSAYSSIPSPQSFRVNSTTLETECLNTDWANLDSTLVVRQISFDVSAYHFFIENYAASEKYLQDIEAPINYDGDSSTFEGYKLALSVSGSASDSDQNLSDERRVLAELQAWSTLKNDLGRKLTDENAPFRLERNLPPNFETLNASSNIWKGQDFKNCFMQALSSPIDSHTYADEKIVFNEKAAQRQSSKQNYKLKKFELISCLLREKNPDKILKLITDLHKMNVNVKQIASRWNVDDAHRGVLMAAASLVGSGPRAQGPDNDYPMILLSKLKQTRDLKNFRGLQVYMNALTRFINEKGRHDKTKMAIFENKMNFQPLYIRMLIYNEPSATAEDKALITSIVPHVKEAFIMMLTTTDSTSPHDRVTMEEIIVTLMNLGEYEFVMANGKHLEWKVIELASLISTFVLHCRGKYELSPAEKKQARQSFENILIGIVQGEVSSKRHRDSTSNQISDKKLLLGFISKLTHIETIDILKAFYVSCFNTTVSDANQTIQIGLQSWPVISKASSVNTDALLALLADLTEENQEDFRTRAEVSFAQENYPAAMKFYLESLIISTTYFTPYKSGMQPTATEWEHILQKMVRCSTELNLHLQTAVLCQFLSGDCDYSTSFKSLEERNSNDAMDPLYDFLWDVTLLEYLVSMHTKRGELSRRRKALEVISQLDINTNNHEEILREAKSTRKSAFFRYLCNAFL